MSFSRRKLDAMIAVRARTGHPQISRRQRQQEVENDEMDCERRYEADQTLLLQAGSDGAPGRSFTEPGPI